MVIFKPNLLTLLMKSFRALSASLPGRVVKDARPSLDHVEADIGDVTVATKATLSEKANQFDCLGAIKAAHCDLSKELVLPRFVQGVPLLNRTDFLARMVIEKSSSEMGERDFAYVNAVVSGC